jgi:hypothetical protein
MKDYIKTFEQFSSLTGYEKLNEDILHDESCIPDFNDKPVKYVCYDSGRLNIYFESKKVIYLVGDFNKVFKKNIFDVQRKLRDELMDKKLFPDVLVCKDKDKEWILIKADKKTTLKDLGLEDTYDGYMLELTTKKLSKF